MILSKCLFRFYENVISKEMSKNSTRLENFGEKTVKEYREKTLLSEMTSFGNVKGSKGSKLMSYQKLFEKVTGQKSAHFHILVQWRPTQMRAFHSNENGLFCTHPLSLSVAPLFW